jgi:hypothetical protein
VAALEVQLLGDLFPRIPFATKREHATRPEIHIREQLPQLDFSVNPGRPGPGPVREIGQYMQAVAGLQAALLGSDFVQPADESVQEISVNIAHRRLGGSAA